MSICRLSYYPPLLPDSSLSTHWSSFIGQNPSYRLIIQRKAVCAGHISGTPPGKKVTGKEIQGTKDEVGDMLVSSPAIRKYHRLSGLNTIIYFLTVLELRSMRSGVSRIGSF